MFARVSDAARCRKVVEMRFGSKLKVVTTNLRHVDIISINSSSCSSSSSSSSSSSGSSSSNSSSNSSTKKEKQQ